VAECERTNEKFTDPDFDIESDIYDNCLYGLERWWWGEVFANGQPRQSGGGKPREAVRNQLADRPRGRQLPERTARGGQDAARETRGGKRMSRQGDEDESGGVNKQGVECGYMMGPGSIHRVDWIFESPQFTVNGYSASDIMQGMNGDCWWLAAVATIAHRGELMQRVCVARDEEAGVYGFCFFRDGEWIHTVVDDNLFLKETDFDYYGDVYDPSGRRASRHRKRYQTGSEALYYAHCVDQNETWLPLLEKAYAKVSHPSSHPLRIL
jgi:hypothetical protein